MNFHIVKTIFLKELKDTMRDSKTLVVMILLPIILYPLLAVSSSPLLFMSPLLLLCCPFLSVNPHLSYCYFLFCSLLSSRKAITSTYFPRSDAILLKDFYDNIITSKLLEFDSNSSLNAMVNSGINSSGDGYGHMKSTSSISQSCMGSGILEQLKDVVGSCSSIHKL